MLNKLKKWTIDLIGEGYKWILVTFVLYLLSILGTIKLKHILQTPIPIWIAFVILLTILCGCLILLLFHSRQSYKPRFYKYCPECDFGISTKSSENYCRCGTKYLQKCPKCDKKIRDKSRVCSFCGDNFPIKPRTGNEWMAK
ncbi:MAG: hypothetical protein AB1306_08265 [Nitrospirota bacterium]